MPDPRRRSAGEQSHAWVAAELAELTALRIANYKRSKFGPGFDALMAGTTKQSKDKQYATDRRSAHSRTGTRPGRAQANAEATTTTTINLPFCPPRERRPPLALTQGNVNLRGYAATPSATRASRHPSALSRAHIALCPGSRSLSARTAVCDVAVASDKASTTTWRIASCSEAPATAHQIATRASAIESCHARAIELRTRDTAGTSHRGLCDLPHVTSLGEHNLHPPPA